MRCINDSPILIAEYAINRDDPAENVINERGAGVNIGFLVNATGKLCLVHDEKFGATPLWVSYHTDRRQVEIIFDNGTTHLIDWEATEEMNNYLLKVDKILIIRLESSEPVEGFDTILLRMRGGMAVI